MEPSAKIHINAVILGGQSHGKSTLIGHMLVKCGEVSTRTIENLKKEAAQMGRGSARYTWIMDETEEERTCGMTIHPTYKKFETDKFLITVTDVPGHHKRYKNALTGIAMADVAILVVSAEAEEFEESVAVGGQTREHPLLAYSFGVKQIIIAVNQMDVTMPPFSEERFKEVRKEVLKFIRKVGFKPERVAVVPVSGLRGDNLVEKSHNMPWYNGWSIGPKDAPTSTGTTLLDAIDIGISAPIANGPESKPLRLPVYDVYKISGIGTVACGRVETGKVTPGMALKISPTGLTTSALTIEMHRELLKEAIVGDAIGIKLTDVSAQQIHRGMVISDENDPAKKTKQFLAQVIIISHPGEIKPGYTPVMDIHTAHVPCTWIEFKEKINRRTGRVIESNPQSLKAGEAAMVIMKPTKDLCVESYSEYPPLGRFIIRDDGIVAVGVVKEVEKED